MNGLHFDFEALLLLATVVTGIIWALDRFLWAPRRDEGQDGNWAIEFSRSFFPVILLVLLLRSFIFEPFRIPSSSMVPTLQVGDFILVNKFAYGLRLPVFHTEILDLGEPQRGDVMVFRWPPDPSKDFIKRVVGLPGDVIEFDGRQITVNDEPVALAPQGLYDGPGVPAFEATLRFTETLGKHTHDILVARDRLRQGLRAEVPPGHYFVMGDNRDNSADSRRWGFVPDDHLVGKAFLIWMSVDTENWRLRFSRIGDSVH